MLRRTAGDERGIPLLYGERLVLGDAKPDHLTLSIESVEVNVGDDPQRAGR